MFAGQYFQNYSPYSLVSIWWNSNFNYKLYTDVVVYYSLLTGTIVLAFLAHHFSTIRMFLHRRVKVIKVEQGTEGRKVVGKGGDEKESERDAQYRDAYGENETGK